MEGSAIENTGSDDPIEPIIDLLVIHDSSLPNYYTSLVFIKIV